MQNYEIVVQGMNLAMKLSYLEWFYLNRFNICKMFGINKLWVD